MMTTNHYKKFEQIFNRRPQSFDCEILNQKDFVDWIMNNFFEDFKSGEITNVGLFVFASYLNLAMLKRIALGLPA